MKNWNEQIDNATKKFIKCFSDLSFEQLNWKPNSESWSIAQNIDHLIVINKSYFPVVDSVRKGTHKTPFLSRIDLIVSLLGNTVLKSVKPDRKKKIKTFSIWEPSKSDIPKDILNRFENHQSELIKLIDKSKDLIDEKVVISSPANKNIVYRLEKAFEIIVTHEQRHFEQAKEVYELLKASS